MINKITDKMEIFEAGNKVYVQDAKIEVQRVDVNDGIVWYHNDNFTAFLNQDIDIDRTLKSMGYSTVRVTKDDKHYYFSKLKDTKEEVNEIIYKVVEEKGDRYLVNEEFAKEVGKKIDTNERFRFDPFTGFESQMELSVWDKYITGLERTCVMYREEVEELYHKYSSIGLNERITELTKESNDLFRQKQDVWRKHDEIKEIAKQNKVSCEKLTQENKKIKKDNMEFVKERGYLAERIEECKAENNLLVELLKIKL